MNKEEIKVEIEKLLYEASKHLTADRDYWKGLAGNWRVKAQEREALIQELENKLEPVALIPAVFRDASSFVLFLAWTGICVILGVLVSPLV